MMEKEHITAVIIDDEELARKVILRYLQKHSEIRVLEECENGFTGLKAINEKNPDLVFLDIQMPKINGFELLEVLEKKPLIIFSTAHDEFAIKAFEHSAIDYLLKPYSQKRFSEAVEKAVKRLQSNAPSGGDLDTLRQEVSARKEELNRIVVKSGSKVEVIPMEEVELLEASGDYVEIHTASAKYLKQTPLSYFEEHLSAADFVRVHRSYIVPVNRIKALEPYSKDNFMLILKSGQEVPVSKSGMKTLRERLQL
ncbi:MAG: LytR/AlgR family response regulator transcription factor [Bacteroidales bacterium]